MAVSFRYRMIDMNRLLFAAGLALLLAGGAAMAQTTTTTTSETTTTSAPGSVPVLIVPVVPPAVALTTTEYHYETKTVTTPAPWHSCPPHNEYDPATDSCVFH